MKRSLIVVIGCLFWGAAQANTYVYHDGRETVSRVLSMSLSATLNYEVPALYSPNNQLSGGDLVITVGRNSFQQICNVSEHISLIALFLGEEEYAQAKQQCDKPSTAVFSGAPFSLRLKVLSTFWEDWAPLTVIHSEGLELSDKELAVVAKSRFKLFIYPIKLGDREARLKQLSNALGRSNLIMSLYDSELFSAQFSKDAIRMMFHQKKSLAAHSLQLVRAGALFSVYSTSQSKMSLTGSYIKVFNASQTLMPPSYPSPLRVAFNPYLIRLYGLVLPTDQSLINDFNICPELGCEEALN